MHSWRGKGAAGGAWQWLLTLVMMDSSRADTNTAAHNRPSVAADCGDATADAALLDEVAAASFAAVAYDRSNAVSDPMALALAD